jgi:hypothetical protein
MVPAIDSIDAALDAALDMTFPASDPVALSARPGNRGVGDDQPASPSTGPGLSLSQKRQVQVKS